MISVWSLQRSKGDLSDIKYIYSWSASLDESIQICPPVRLSDWPSVSTQTSYWDETFPKVFFHLQVVYKSELAGSDNYIL